MSVQLLCHTVHVSMVNLSGTTAHIVTGWLAGMQWNVCKPELCHPQGSPLSACISTQLMGYHSSNSQIEANSHRLMQLPTNALVQNFEVLKKFRTSVKISGQHWNFRTLRTNFKISVISGNLGQRSGLGYIYNKNARIYERCPHGIAHIHVCAELAMYVSYMLAHVTWNSNATHGIHIGSGITEKQYQVFQLQMSKDKGLST